MHKMQTEIHMQLKYIHIIPGSPIDYCLISYEYILVQRKNFMLHSQQIENQKFQVN